MTFQWGKQNGVEQDFWLKFSGEKNLGRNYDKINPTAFVSNSIYICFFRNPIYLWQKDVKQNGVNYNECGNITQMSLNNVQWHGITSRKNYENFIVETHNFIIENDTRNLKFIMFHADDINSAKMFKRILRKIEWDSVDKLVCDTRTNFLRPIYLACNPNFESFAKLNAFTTRLYKS